MVLLVGARDPPWITLPIHGELFHDGPVGAGSTSAEAYGAGACGAGVHLFGRRGTFIGVQMDRRYLNPEPCQMNTCGGNFFA